MRRIDYLEQTARTLAAQGRHEDISRVAALILARLPKPTPEVAQSRLSALLASTTKHRRTS